MNINPGTRVRSTEDFMNGAEGTYVKFDKGFHWINWDAREDPDYNDLHDEDEFEVI